MLKQIKSPFLYAILTVLLSLAITIEPTNAQQVYKSLDEIGGGGSGSQRNEESGSSNTMYIVGGVLILGIILYSVLKEKKPTDKTDSTEVSINKLSYPQELNYKEQLSKLQSELPVNVYVGSHSNEFIRDDRRYFIGVSVGF
ncbi:MAG: hypothetical protein IPM56_09805 [Ignavibacteriales bacterium]|nr:MAG: hypothetical protein IPM56_09805 [Ignavibacteriales bacterium]